ncbi:MAG: NusG domain II-containing protein [Gallionella sp.]|nr:NusG domain II-containing protein [Gallionella sp.]
MSSHELSGIALRRYLRPGDWLILLLGAGIIGLMIQVFWQGGQANTVIIRAGGKVFLEAPLSRDREIEVPGPLGQTRVLIEKGRARVAADPSPRQYCVKQGWLSQAGEVAVCLPNEISVELSGGTNRYDSLNY